MILSFLHPDPKETYSLPHFTEVSCRAKLKSSWGITWNFFARIFHTGFSILHLINVMKKVVLILFFFPAWCKAQPFIDLVSAYYQYSAADKPDHNNTVYTGLASVALTIPMKVDSDYIVINPVYENFRMTFPYRFIDREFHVGYVPISWLHYWNSRWKTAFVFIPRISSRLHTGLGRRDMQYGGAIVTTYQKSETLKYKFGVYYNKEFFNDFVLPLLGIDWNINSKWNLFGVLPGSMNLEYKFRKSMHAGIMFRSYTNSYRTFDYNFIRVNDNHLKLFLDLYLSKKQVISIEAGHTILRKYRSGYRKSGDSDYYSMNVTDGFLFRLAYSFRMRTDEGK